MRISVVVPALVSLLIPLAAPAGPAQAADSARLQAQVNRAAASGQDCAVFDGHRYCLGLGFTDQSEPEARASLARLVATRSARTTAEQTGDIDTAPGAERRTQADRRAEFASAAASLDKVRDLESPDSPEFSATELKDTAQFFVPIDAMGRDFNPRRWAIAISG
mgnify:CR=1 FL=1